MTLLINFVTGTLLLLVALDRAQASPQSLPMSEEEEISMERLKRQSITTCTFSSLYSICNFPDLYVVGHNVSVSAEIKNIGNREIADVEINGAINGSQVFFERVGRNTDPVLPRKCVGDICFVLYNVVPKELSACIKLEDMLTSITLKEVGCFQTALFGLGETTTIANSIGNTSLSTNSLSSPMSESSDSSNRSTGTTQGMDNSTKDGQNTNGSHRIGISLITLPLLFTFFKFLLL